VSHTTIRLKWSEVKRLSWWAECLRFPSVVCCFTELFTICKVCSVAHNCHSPSMLSIQRSYFSVLSHFRDFNIFSFSSAAVVVEQL